MGKKYILEGISTHFLHNQKCIAGMLLALLPEVAPLVEWHHHISNFGLSGP